jgi:flagellar motor protein MotB
MDMKLKILLAYLFITIFFSLSGCTLLCRGNCPKVDYRQQSCQGAVCGVFPKPCPAIDFPGFYPTDYNCLEKLQRLTALRSRGIGVIILGDRLRIILPTDTLFKRDSLETCTPEISDCHLKTLADIAEIIKCISCVPIVISGHTDDVGTKCDRMMHSRAMAQTVAAHLWAQGIPWDRLRVIGRADCDPIGSDGSVFGSTDNRRVEIRLDFSRNYIENCRYNNSYCPDCMNK